MTIVFFCSAWVVSHGSHGSQASHFYWTNSSTAKMANVLKSSKFLKEVWRASDSQSDPAHRRTVVLCSETVAKMDRHSPSSETKTNPLSVCSCLTVPRLTAGLRGFWPSGDAFGMGRRQEEKGPCDLVLKLLCFCQGGKEWSSRKITCWKIKWLVTKSNYYWFV